MPNRVIVAGVGMIAFAKPGASESYDVMGAKAALKALENAGLSQADVQQAVVGYVYGDSTCGQAAIYRIGMTGIPIVNVNNNCSTGSSALFLARQLVESGLVDCVMALGFEQMRPGALVQHWNDRPSPFARFDEICDGLLAGQDAPMEAERFLIKDFEIQEASEFAFTTFKRLMYYTCDKPDKFLPEVTEALTAFEDQSMTQAAQIEARATRLFTGKADPMATDELTDYSTRKAGEALRLGKALLGSIEARHRLLYGYRAPTGTAMSGYGHPDGIAVDCRPQHH